MDAVYAEITGRGVKAQSPPEDFEGRIRDFRVIDPDGNKLDFEIAHRRLVPTAEFLAHLWMEKGFEPIYHQALVEAGLM